MVVKFFWLSNVKLVKVEQSRKRLFPRVVTNEGIVTDVKPVQVEKQLSPKLITDEGIVSVFKLVQL